MKKKPVVVYVIASHKPQVLKDCFYSSPMLKDGKKRYVAIMEDYTNVPKAYNDAIDNIKADIYVFAHHDMIFPDGWEERVINSIDYLEKMGYNIGVLGIAGALMSGDQNRVTGCMNTFGTHNIISKGLPHRVETLDECVLIMTQKNLVKFDENIPTNHCYGVDVCILQEIKRRQNFVIDAFATHMSDTNKNGITAYKKTLFGKKKLIDKSYLDAATYISEKYPTIRVGTTCSVITGLKYKHDNR